jgi:Mg/Co/Ni transporter MgtE
LKRAIAIAAVAGFLMPVLWGTIAFIGFGTPESTASELFWDVVYVTCPPWLITGPPPLGYGPATALMNAALYGAVVSVCYPLLKRFRRVT